MSNAIHDILCHIRDTDRAFFEQAHRFIGHTVDQTMCVTYYEIGHMIVEKEQEGENRADYGSKLLAGLSEYLGAKFGKGFSLANLKNGKAVLPCLLT